MHSHSGEFCSHAQGTLRQVVEAAVEKGFTHYGLSEHMPRFRTQDLYPEEQHLSVKDLMRIFDAYVLEARKLQEEFKDRIKLLVGMESEFIYPEMAEDIQRLRNSYQLDYIVGSVHHVCNGMPMDFDLPGYEKCIEKSGSEEDMFCDYFDAQYTLMAHIQPEIIGHFDLCRLGRPLMTTFSEKVWSKIKRNIDYGISYGALFEINASAYKIGLSDAYPVRNILRVCIHCCGIQLKHHSI